VRAAETITNEGLVGADLAEHSRERSHEQQNGRNRETCDHDDGSDDGIHRLLR